MPNDLNAARLKPSPNRPGSPNSTMKKTLIVFGIQLGEPSGIRVAQTVASSPGVGVFATMFARPRTNVFARTGCTLNVTPAGSQMSPTFCMTVGMSTVGAVPAALRLRTVTRCGVTRTLTGRKTTTFSWWMTGPVALPIRTRSAAVRLSVPPSTPVNLIVVCASGGSCPDAGSATVTIDGSLLSMKSGVRVSRKNRCSPAFTVRPAATDMTGPGNGASDPRSSMSGASDCGSPAGAPRVKRTSTIRRTGKAASSMVIARCRGRPRAAC